ncbi:copper-binding protein [Inhella gelatinilytica]|uniref:Copper-binding protein n=1 Tax=Inhella gelatinilytica TaxID=2795030 RepID=A0A931IX45_9BURK|nr:copper-binding protein [Inhella gelatinilytica]MBH9552268.1 copper-binding protein [Inhella gelatinilytica]
MKWVFAFLLCGVSMGTVQAHNHAHSHGAGHEAAAPAATDEWVDGEVRKLELAAGKVQLKHGPIKHMDMPPMTMVFHVKEPALLNGLQVGDKLKFRVVREGGKFMVTEIQR